MSNHFLEVQQDENGNIYVMVHSGSRQIGKKLGDYFNELAEKINKKWYSQSSEVPFLAVDSDEGQAYISWTDLACKFAYLSRRVMLNDVKDCLRYEFPSIEFLTGEITDKHIEDIYSVHHNYARLENVFGSDLMVHRKGACSARNGEIGIIPGSMGSFSHIVIGKGERLSLSSSSHGAGRKCGRKAFCRDMVGRYNEVEESLKGIVHSEFGEFMYGKDKGLKDISECPQAYKSIEDVMSQQKDLVSILVKLRPLISIKG